MISWEELKEERTVMALKFLIEPKAAATVSKSKSGAAKTPQTKAEPKKTEKANPHKTEFHFDGDTARSGHYTPEELEQMILEARVRTMRHEISQQESVS